MPSTVAVARICPAACAPRPPIDSNRSSKKRSGLGNKTRLFNINNCLGLQYDRRTSHRQAIVYLDETIPPRGPIVSLACDLRPSLFSPFALRYASGSAGRFTARVEHIIWPRQQIAYGQFERLQIVAGARACIGRALGAQRAGWRCARARIWAAHGAPWFCDTGPNDETHARRLCRAVKRRLFEVAAGFGFPLADGGALTLSIAIRGAATSVPMARSPVSSGSKDSPMSSNATH